jgi:hypothetical protein
MYFQQMIDKHDMHARLLGRMMERCGLDIGECCEKAMGMMVYRAARTCLSCSSTEACRQWLADPASGSGPADFCPNARLFREFQQLT